MKKITFSELCEEMQKYNEQNGTLRQFEGEQKIGYIVYKKESFTKAYPLKSRTYSVASGNKYFLPNMCGKSLFGNCLDGSELGVRLDWYFGRWKIDYCYFKEATK